MNWFILALKNTFNFKGRARRKEYGWFVLITALISFSVGFLKEASASLNFTFLFQTLSIINILLYLVISLIGISLSVRRLHDMGYSGWWILIGTPRFISDIYFSVTLASDEEIWNAISQGTFLSNALIVSLILSSILTLICLFKDGQPRANRYGDSPKYSAEALEAAQGN